MNSKLENLNPRRRKTPSTSSNLVCATILGLTQTIASAMPPHLERGLDLDANIVNAALGGEFLTGAGEAINEYGGSWNGQGQNAVVVTIGDPQANILPQNRSKCGSFVTKLLETTYPQWGGWSQYHFVDPFPLVDPIKSDNPPMDWTASPAAYEYMELIQNEQGFTEHVELLSDVCPGDVFVKRNEHDHLGHVMLVVDIDWQNPFPYNGGLYYEVLVLDCSEDYHSNDSRQPFGTNGVGTGSVGVLVDQAFKPIAYSWSLPNGAKNTWAGQLPNKLEYIPDPNNPNSNGTHLVFGKLDLPIPEESCDPIATPGGTDILAPDYLLDGLDIVYFAQDLQRGDRFATETEQGVFAGIDWSSAKPDTTNPGQIVVPWVAIEETATSSTSTTVRYLLIQSDGYILGLTDPAQSSLRKYEVYTQRSRPIAFGRESR